MEDIKYERNGVEKMAGAKHKQALKDAGWSVVGEEAKKKPGRPAKVVEPVEEVEAE